MQLYTYGPGATRGETDTFTVTFNAADEDGLAVRHRRPLMAARGATLRVTGYQEFMRACKTAEKESRTYVRGSFRSRRRHRQRSRRPENELVSSSRSAAGYRTRVRQRGVAVEQALPKTTGQRGDWGATQMRKALVPALDENQEKVADEFEKAMDKVADHFETSP